MSQLFDRFGRIVRSFYTTPPKSSQDYHDSEMKEAWEELESFLKGDDTAVRKTGPQTAPPEELRADYRLLKLPHGAPFAQVRTSYTSLLREFHPDRNSSQDAAEKTREIIAAFRRIKAWETQQAKSR